VSGPVQGPGLSLHYLHTLWSELDTEGRSFLKYRQVEELVNWLNLHLSTSALQAMFAKVDTNHNGELDFDEFCHLIVLLRVRKSSADSLFSPLPTLRSPF
jgi:Ca2+-binding EF-hand superfamily protein